MEDAFAARLNQLENFGLTAPKHQNANGLGNQSSQVDAAEQTVTVISRPARERDREHLKFVASQPCPRLRSNPFGSAPHRVCGVGRDRRKVSDRFSVAVCRLHHRELHRRGNERT